MGQEPEAIREQIEQTRERMGDTIDALGYKADVPARARESIGGKVGSIKDRVSGIGAGVSSAAPDSADVKAGAKRAAGLAQQNPLGLAIGAAAAGFLAGLLVPASRVEDEHIGPVADQIKEHAKQTSHDALEHGRQVAQETAQVASQKVQEAANEVKDTAQQSAQSHADAVSDGARRSVEDVQQTAGR
jgi:gas vesicle protein